MINLSDLDISNKRVLIRLDLNVPIKNNIIESESRILAALPTIEFALKKNAKVIIMSHLGRPKYEKYEKKLSLFPIYEYLKKKIKHTKVNFSNNYLSGVNINAGELLILENVRFNPGEKNNNISLSKKYANLCDIFVMDAFGTSHRIESSTYGIAEFAPIACAGPLLKSELKILSQALKNPQRPLIAIVGGAKVSTKFNILNSLTKIADTIIVGGGIANTFIAADYSVGKSLHEPEFINQAKILKENNNIIIPVDSRVGTHFSKNSPVTIKKINEIKKNEEIMDFGDQTIKNMIHILKKAKTILWNGPVGVFEFPNFRKGTQMLAMTIANSNAFSIAGGGDTLSVIDMFNIKKNISYVSTGGGAFLQFLEGNTLPTVKILQQRSLEKI
ncbi:phosphoglycerate kinase [Buchnera aphidicola (Pemphigus obesinymphae)]|uniref:phosphoglycerate kinase n=1 Tax=Buchnera aphidicola TaxID=9 RepID=UPI0022372DE0|nr:phosphoglycerate kinase [Buchnera aphidicola]MCW5196360.1 phosphoglycerate kinase [Buchnera aphidicola (Pemphigus obesinymphae)]